jgi:hypothetical protein
MEFEKFYGSPIDQRLYAVQPPDPPEPQPEPEVLPPEPPTPQETNELAPAAPAKPEKANHRRPAPAIRQQTGPPGRRLIEPERHSRKCQICHHPDREQIEEDFLHWRRPHSMSNEYGFSETVIFRHGHAMGLFTLRRENLRLALDNIIQIGTTTTNGDTIIRAIRAQACLTDDNRWVEPPKRVVFINETPESPPADNLNSANLVGELPKGGS